MLGRLATPRGLAALGGTAVATVALQYTFGTAEDFFDGKFITHKHPDDLVEFYQAEELLKVVAVHPLIVKAGLTGIEFKDIDPDHPAIDPRSGKEWDAVTESETTGLEVSFVLTETEEDTTGDGELDTVAAFQRHERFINHVPLLPYIGIKILLWDQTWNYGYKRRSDGSSEVYHHGESFYGPFPVRLVVAIHQRYVLWACEKHVNSDVFGGDDIDYDALEEQIAFIPAYAFKKFIHKMIEEEQKAIQILGPNEEHQAALDKLEAMRQREDHTVSVAVTKTRDQYSQGCKRVSAQLHIEDTEATAAIQTALSHGSKAGAAALEELVHATAKDRDVSWSKKVIAEFAAGGDSEYTLPASLSEGDRAKLHVEAAQAGLHSLSSGDGADRKLRVWRGDPD